MNSSLSGSTIPPHLAIRVLYCDQDIVVVHKPCNLRSVPGHANPPPPPTPTPTRTTTTTPPSSDSPRDRAPTNAGRKRRRVVGVDGANNVDGGGIEGEGGGSAAATASSSSSSSRIVQSEAGREKSHRLTAQEAWIEAIRSFGRRYLAEEDNNYKNDVNGEGGGGGSGGRASVTEEEENFVRKDGVSDGSRGQVEEEAVCSLACELLRGLASSDRNLCSVPRKIRPFVDYCRRNRRRLLHAHCGFDDDIFVEGGGGGGGGGDIQGNVNGIGWGRSRGVSQSQGRPMGGGTTAASRTGDKGKADAKDKGKGKVKADGKDGEKGGEVLDTAPTLISDVRSFEYACTKAHGMIRYRQVPLLSIPPRTRQEESALGQIELLLAGVDGRNGVDKDDGKGKGKGNTGEAQRPRVVHRLDCETSGIMVFALTPEAASALSRSWRERYMEASGSEEGRSLAVRKTYAARVKFWPPYHEGGMAEGRIDLPLGKSAERLKWEVKNIEDGGKESRTLWKIWEERGESSIDDVVHDDDEEEEEGKREKDVHAEKSGDGRWKDGDDNNNNNKNRGEESKPDSRHRRRMGPVTLELVPITGRTHQLRVHCAAVGSGIEGDSLYGDGPLGTAWDPTRLVGKVAEAEDVDANAERATTMTMTKLKLHAHRLSFPHPRSGERMEFVSPVPWL